MNHDDTGTMYRLPPDSTGEHHSYAELTPLPDPLEPDAALAYAPRHQQVMKALAHLAGMVDVWGARMELRNLDSYLHRRIPGDPHPLGGLRPYRQYNDAVTDAATMLRHPHGDGVS